MMSLILKSPSWLKSNGWQLVAALTVFSTVPLCATAASEPVRERLSFDANWRFTKGDPAGTGDELSYKKIKPWMNSTGNEFVKDGKPTPRPKGNLGENVVYTQPGFDDSNWRELNLPHDWGIEGPFNQHYPGSTGRLHWWGIGWYRKHFNVAASDKGRRFYLDVDGAMSYANVWLNGHYVGGWPYGYSSWKMDLTPYIKFGGENIIAIRLDNPPDSSRWYPGGGIYRNVWLVKTGPVHVEHWGTYVTTPEVTAKEATVHIRVTVDNDSASDATLTVQNEVCELKANGKKGRPVTSISTSGVLVAAHKTESTQSQVTLKKPRLWSLEKPQRYVVVTSIEQHGKTVDRYETAFGIRTIKFDADKGFFLNGKHVHL
ncbi:MAG TPA: beta galactosidase jelly roll domain-containing protein, partial [Verrucomicrobiae bacterium]|nr:beta galactosidase jelly roll domain-containing protein [Verrucomicrobiae bacterium]